MIPVAMDAFSGRQHLYAAPQAILALLLFWALFGLRRGQLVGGAVAAAMVVATAVSFPQNLVRPFVFSLDYARRAIASGTHADQPFHVVVITQKRSAACGFEPCTGSFGKGVGGGLQHTMGFYETLAGLEGRVFGSAIKASPENAAAAIAEQRSKPGDVIVIDVDDAATRYRELKRW